MVRGTLRVPRYPRLVVVQKALRALYDDERAIVIDPTFEYGLQLLIVVSVCLTSEPLSAAPTGCD